MEKNQLWYLKRINVFRELEAGAIEKMERAAQPRSFQRRQLVSGPEDAGDAVYLLREGRMKLSRFDDSGKEITLAILEPGELFGEEALAGAERRRTYAEALDDGKVWRISRGEFERLLREIPDLAIAIARQLSERLLGARGKLEELSFRDVPSRLAAMLLELDARHGEDLPGGRRRIGLRLTHQELASLISSTRETTTALLNQFKREGLVETDDRWLLVVDPEGLRARAQSE